MRNKEQNRLHQIAYRERNKDNGIKEIRGLKVKIEHEPLIKKKVKAFIIDLEKQLAEIE